MNKNSQESEFRKIKLKHQSMITSFLGVIIFAFLYLFIPLSDFGISFTKDFYESLTKFVSSPFLAMIIGIPLFASDPLVTGKNKYCVFIQQYYPSDFIAKKYKIDGGEATALWFDFFNKWGKKTSAHYETWKSVFDRTYKCRLIYYMTRLLCLTVILSIIGILVYYVLSLKEIYSKGINFEMFFFLFLQLAALLFLTKTNKLPEKNKKATGCWFKYKEISEIERAIVKSTLFKNAKTFNVALEYVKHFNG